MTVRRLDGPQEPDEPLVPLPLTREQKQTLTDALRKHETWECALLHYEARVKQLEAEQSSTDIRIRELEEALQRIADGDAFTTLLPNPQIAREALDARPL